jgi:hypothetical protein
LARRAERSHCPSQRTMAQNRSFAKSRRNAGQNPWRGARTFPHRTSRPCLMRGGKSHLRGFGEHERASWLRIRSAHLEWCMGGTSCGPSGAPKATNPAAAGSGNGGPTRSKFLRRIGLLRKPRNEPSKPAPYCPAEAAADELGASASTTLESRRSLL